MFTFFSIESFLKLKYFKVISSKYQLTCFKYYVYHRVFQNTCIINFPYLLLLKRILKKNQTNNKHQVIHVRIPGKSISERVLRKGVEIKSYPSSF